VGSVRGAVMGEMGESFRLVLWTDIVESHVVQWQACL
jgi:hypothetical protein